MDLNLVPFDDWHVDNGSRPNPIPVGTVRVDKSADPAKRYIWGKVAQTLINDAFAANEVAVQSSATTFEFTNDLSAGVGGTAGTAVGLCRANSAAPESTASNTTYAWFQIGGIGTIKTNGDNDGVAGDALTVVGDGTANVVVDDATSADGVILRSFAICLASEASSAVSALLRCPDFAGL